MLSRDIRSYTAAMFQPSMPHDQADLLASLIEEEDWTASLGETLYPDRAPGRAPAVLGGRPGAGQCHARPGCRRDAGHHAQRPQGPARSRPRPNRGCLPSQALRERCLKLGAELPWAERGAILTLLGSAERAFYLIERIDAERKSVSRAVPAAAVQQPRELEAPLGGAAVPA